MSTWTKGWSEHPRHRPVRGCPWIQTSCNANVSSGSGLGSHPAFQSSSHPEFRPFSIASARSKPEVEPVWFPFPLPPLISSRTFRKCHQTHPVGGLRGASEPRPQPAAHLPYGGGLDHWGAGVRTPEGFPQKATRKQHGSCHGAFNELHSHLLKFGYGSK